MKTLYFLRGLPASGKTTWAIDKLATLNMGGRLAAVRTNKDEIRKQLGGGIEGKVIRRETELVTEALKAGLEVIIDNTHFNPLYERQYRLLAEKYGYRFGLKSFVHVSLDECIRRDKSRPSSVGQAVIRRMHAQYLVLRPGGGPKTQARLFQLP